LNYDNLNNAVEDFFGNKPRGDDNDQKFKFETLGGDASLLHLASQIDRGIKKKMKEKESPEARNWRKCHSRLFPLRSLALFTYIFQTQFEQPSWCITNEHLSLHGNAEEKAMYKDWDPTNCQNPEMTYTNSRMPKMRPWASHLLEIACLLILIAFQLARNKYRDMDKSSA
jgi:hypothetical protein